MSYLKVEPHNLPLISSLRFFVDMKSSFPVCQFNKLLKQKFTRLTLSIDGFVKIARIDTVTIPDRQKMVRTGDLPVLHCLGIGSSVSHIRSDQIGKYMSKI